MTDSPLARADLALPLVCGLACLTGLMVGSFLNVVVYRVPAGLSVVSPRSACPACGHALRDRDNIPVVSWLLLRGRCRDCAEPISARYPAVEAGTALLFGLVAARTPASPELLALLIVTSAGVALALIDLEHQRLPFALTGTAAALAGTALAGGWAWTWRAWGAPAAWDQALPALGGAALWLTVYGLIHLVTSGRGMGLGDVALAPVLGLALGAVGTEESVVGLASGFALGAVVGVLLLARGRARGGSRLPFGPFMLVGSAVGLFAGPTLAAAYLGLTGLA